MVDTYSVASAATNAGPGRDVSPPSGRPVTIIGLLWPDAQQPVLASCHSSLTGRPGGQAGPAVYDEARTLLMQDYAAQFGVSVETIEVHDVVVLPGHLTGVEMRQPEGGTA